MNFISLEFILFFIILLVAMKISKGIKAHHIILLIASYTFYAMGDLKFLALLFGVSLLMWYLAKYIEKNKGTKKAKTGLIVGVVADVLVLGIFKYFNFFTESFSQLFGFSHTTLNIVLPLGISFYIFQSISYIADVYTEKVKSEKSLTEIMLYIGFFPQIVSGPIVKAHDFLPQLKVDHEITRENLSWGIQKFASGLFKKIVIADRLGVSVDAVFSAPSAYSGMTLAITVLIYAMQIYYDFSGYSDMAIGVARMLGFDLGKNFNLPYLAKNPSDFWRRWHISLSSWFRDYVYIPLGGSRKGKFRTYLNLFITMLLSGLWHGASWAFVFWGACHAFASVVHKFFTDIKKKTGELKNTTAKKVVGALSILLTFSVIYFLYIPFRASDLSEAMLIIGRIFSWSNGINYVYVFGIIFAVFLVAVEIISVIKNNGNDIWRPLDLSKWHNKLIFSFFILLTLSFAYFGNSAFIYAQF